MRPAIVIRFTWLWWIVPLFGTRCEFTWKVCNYFYDHDLLRPISVWPRQWTKLWLWDHLIIHIPFGAVNLLSPSFCIGTHIRILHACTYCAWRRSGNWNMINPYWYYCIHARADLVYPNAFPTRFKYAIQTSSICLSIFTMQTFNRFRYHEPQSFTNKAHKCHAHT